jgi:hypothetical protein
MTLQSYNKALPKETLEVYKKHFAHLDLVKPKKTSQARADSSFLVPKNSNNDRYSLEDSLSPSDIQEETEQFISQCLEEYITWLAQAELNRTTLALSTIEPFQTTYHTAPQNKEATTE